VNQAPKPSSSLKVWLVLFFALVFVDLFGESSQVFTSGISSVKWNKVNQHVLASSHDIQVFFSKSVLFVCLKKRFEQG
jgi:hypothetical protein